MRLCRRMRSLSANNTDATVLRDLKYWQELINVRRYKFSKYDVQNCTDSLLHRFGIVYLHISKEDREDIGRDFFGKLLPRKKL